MTKCGQRVQLALPHSACPRSGWVMCDRWTVTWVGFAVAASPFLRPQEIMLML